MGRYAARRLLHVVPVFIGATFLIFALVFALPGDPIRALTGTRRVAPATEKALRERYHLDEPLLVRYGHYVSGIVRGDFGETLRGRDVKDLVVERAPVSAKLALATIGIEAVLGIAAGALAAIRRRSFLDQLVLVSTVALLAIPIFVLGVLVQLVVGVELGWLPVAGTRAGWRSYVLPAVVLAVPSLAYIARLTRASMVEVMRSDYVRTAIANGLPRRRVVGVHALRNSLIPVVTFLGVDLGALMGGAIITEGIFNLPGIGNAIFTGIRLQDGPLVVSLVTMLVIVYLLVNLATDLLYAVLDPRIRHA